MLNLTVKYNCSISDDIRKYPDYSAAESFIEQKCERLADFGWHIKEVSGSNSKAGKIECKISNERIDIEWETK